MSKTGLRNRPVPSTLNECGVAVTGIDKISVPIPETYKAEATICVAYLDSGPSKTGWRGEFSTRSGAMGCSGPIVPRLTAYRTRDEAVAAAVTRLANYWLNASTRGTPGERKHAKLIYRAVMKFSESVRNGTARLFTAARADVDETEVRDFVSVRTGKAKPSELARKPDGSPDFCSLHRKDNVPAVIEAVHGPTVDRLSSGERRELASHEKTIEKSAMAFLDLGNALAEISEKRLYRETHERFEDYLAERWKIERSVAYRCISAVKLKRATSAIADKLRLRLTNEAQYRALEGLDAPDAVEVLKLAAKRIEPTASGEKIPTAKILAEVKREYSVPAEDLDRAQERREERAAQRKEQAGAEKPTFAIVGTKGEPEAGWDSRYVWNGKETPWAPLLHDCRQSLEELAHRFPGMLAFRDDLSALLASLAVEIKTGKIRPIPAQISAARKAR